MRVAWPLTLGVLLGALCSIASAQDRLPEMPRYDRFERLRRQISSSVVRGDVSVTWSEDGSSCFYEWQGKRWKWEASGKVTETTEQPPKRAERAGRRRASPDRGRQYTEVFSSDGKRRAFFRDQNVFLSDADGMDERQVSMDGNVAARTKNGQASWVYGEELYVREAMWFSPDGRYLAYYHFNESAVRDYYVVLDQTKFQATLDVEAYPKAGTDNPTVEIRVYDTVTGQSAKVDGEFGPDGKELAHYLYQVRWSPDGTELFYHRTNRKQNRMQWCAYHPAKLASRVILEESRPQSWTDNAPPLTWLEDGQRFIWTSERNGYRNLYLYQVTGKLLQVLTRHECDVQDVVRVDEKLGVVFYTARSAPNPYRLQLHRVGLNGRGERRLTDPGYHHRVQVSPSGKHFVDTAETNNEAPVTRVIDANGKAMTELARSDLTKFESLGLKKTKVIEFLAADGQTKLYGEIQFPSDFDAGKKYPVLVSTYAGPDSGGGFDRFQLPNVSTEFGFLVASFEGRGTLGRGKAFKEAVYGKLGVVEIDDQAAGAKYLQTLPYVDGKRIGIHGVSYGGYASAMALLRHPEAFAAACASASVTDWRHYDTIYTERYMGLPWENENLKGYVAGSAITYAKQLKGRLMLFFGTADNNVHPSNSLQLAQALNSAGKSYEMMAGPDQGHTGLGFARMMEFFIDHLVLSNRAAKKSAATASAALGRLGRASPRP
jgi:dipeptidyl-peptidase-4